MINIPNIQHVQTILLEETLAELKKKSHKQCTKDALTAAVEHFLECNEGILRAALLAARDNLKEGCSKETIKQIDNALGENNG